MDDGITLKEDSIKGLFDLDEKQQEKVRVWEMKLEECAAWPMLNIPQNTMTESLFTLKGAEEYVLLTEGGATYALEARKIRPAVAKGEYRAFALGRNRGDEPVIVIEDGFMWAGLAIPMRAEEVEAIQKEMRRFAFGPAGGYVAKEQEAEQEEGEQMEVGNDA